MSPHRASVCRVNPDLKEPWEHVGWLTPDDKKARVELPQVGVQILQTLEEKAEQEQRRKRRRQMLIRTCSSDATPQRQVWTTWSHLTHMSNLHWMSPETPGWQKIRRMHILCEWTYCAFNPLT